MVSSEFLDEDVEFESVERLDSHGATSETFIVKIKGKNYFMKRLRAEFVCDLRYHCIFNKEYEVGSSLDSEYIPKYERIKNEDGEVYILMEYIIGENIDERLKSDPRYFWKEKNVYRMLLQLLKGLSELHKKDIIYSDMNPRNVMLTKYGNNVKICDLGFCVNASFYQTAGSTVGFSAPEVVAKRLNEIDAQSDIYSLGLLLQYIKENSGAKFSRRINSFMERCLSYDKKGRFTNCEEAIEALMKGHRWCVAGAIVSVIAIVIVGSVMLLSGRTTQMDSTTVSGVNYSVISHEERTCMVTGGVGDRNNIYISSEIEIGENNYKTVAIIDSAFSDRGIYSVYIPEGVESIGMYAFRGCDSIITINLPNSIKEFADAFVDMRNLNKVKIPVIKEISCRSFVGCENLMDIYIPDGVERICLDAFVSCKALKRVRLPETLKVLERGVFYNCIALEEITIPAQVQEIGDYAFHLCDSLQRVYCHAVVPPRITTIFDRRSVIVYVPPRSFNAYKNDFNWGMYDIRPMDE